MNFGFLLDGVLLSSVIFLAFRNYSPSKWEEDETVESKDQPFLKDKKIKNLCVFCGSRAGNDPEFQQTTQKFVDEMNSRGINLVYGGGNIGIMGMVARGIDEGGGKVVGIIPQSLAPREISGDINIGTRVTVPDMHTRKLTMYRLADAFVALPGGFGTFEELMEVITWAQLGIHTKPIGILNIAGYYDPLVAMFHQGIRQGFIGEELGSKIVVVDSNPCNLLERLEKHTPPQSAIKWMDEGQIQ